jgi:hypothetical protein
METNTLPRTGATLEPPMPEPAPKPELLRSLGRLVRGLSALFWGLPATLVVCVQTAKMDILRPFGVLPPVFVTGWLAFGLWQLGYFQKQERIWMQALDKAKWLALINLGLSPFIYFWSRLPDQLFYNIMVLALAVCGLLFLGALNLVLYRLTAMLPDEALRQETRYFTTLNRYLVVGIFFLGAMIFALLRFPQLLQSAGFFLQALGPTSPWLLVFLILLPLAMTMALIWKIKEVIMDSIFGSGR